MDDPVPDASMEKEEPPAEPPPDTRVAVSSYVSAACVCHLYVVQWPLRHMCWLAAKTLNKSCGEIAVIRERNVDRL